MWKCTLIGLFNTILVYIHTQRHTWRFRLIVTFYLYSIWRIPIHTLTLGTPGKSRVKVKLISMKAHKALQFLMEFGFYTHNHAQTRLYGFRLVLNCTFRFLWLHMNLNPFCFQLPGACDFHSRTCSVSNSHTASNYNG